MIYELQQWLLHISFLKKRNSDHLKKAGQPGHSDRIGIYAGISLWLCGDLRCQSRGLSAV